LDDHGALPLSEEDPNGGPASTATAFIAGVAAVLWAGSHLLVHAPRGWPMDVPGEWDLLLTSLAIAQGAAPDAALGTLHGHELGSYLVAALIALPVWLGVDAVEAAKYVAMGFGAGSAATIGWLSVTFGVSAGLDRRHALSAGLVSGVITAAAWPGLHFELAGVNGRTPESLLPQLLAVALLVTLPPSAGRAQILRRSVSVGALLSLGWLLSPVTLWTLGACGLAALWMLGSWGDRGVASAGAALGVALPLVLFALLIPGGAEGLDLFRVEQFGGGLAVSAEASGTPTAFALLGFVHSALEGGAHNPELTFRPAILGLLGWSLLLALLGAIITGARSGTPRAPRVLAAGIALSWLVPLFLLPSEKWFYPLAFRYWVLMLAIGIAVLPVLLLQLKRPGSMATAGLALLGLLCALTLPRSFIAPAPSRAEALVSTGAHRMNPRPGRDRHATFLALYPYVPTEAKVALAEGYGLALGGDMAVDHVDERPGVPPWVALRDAIDDDALAGFLVGVGCGVTAVRDVPDSVSRALQNTEPELRPALLWGVGRCAGERPFPALEPTRAFQAGRAGSNLGGIQSSVPEPGRLMPPRW